MAERFQYNYSTMVQQLYDEPRTLNLQTSYEALHAKVQRMAEMSRTATLTEKKAICQTLNKEVENYPFLLSGQQVLDLKRMTDVIIKDMPEELARQAANTQLYIFRMRNLTGDIDSLSENDQDYLNRHHWTVIHDSKGNNHLDAFTARGEHYTADQQTGYLHVKRENYGNGLRIQNTLENLRPGRYRVSAVVRAKKTNNGHSGLLVFAQVGDKTVLKEIPAEGDTAGNVWFSALHRFSKGVNAHEGILGLDLNKASAHGGQGYGWNRIYLDEITVTDDNRNSNLTYGVTLSPDVALNAVERSDWFSACDFIVERVSD